LPLVGERDFLASSFLDPIFAGLEAMQAHSIPGVISERLRLRFPDEA
jgi:hypothetical protein